MIKFNSSCLTHQQGDPLLCPEKINISPRQGSFSGTRRSPGAISAGLGRVSGCPRTLPRPRPGGCSRWCRHEAASRGQRGHDGAGLRAHPASPRLSSPQDGGAAFSPLHPGSGRSAPAPPRCEPKVSSGAPHGAAASSGPGQTVPCPRPAAPRGTPPHRAAPAALPPPF